MPTPQIQADALLVAVAQDLNDELIILLSAMEEAARALPNGSPARISLAEAFFSAQKCAEIALSLLAHQHRRGLKGIATTTVALTTNEC